MLINRRVLLVQPVLKGQLMQATPDLGLGFLATALRRDGYEVEILDCICKGWSIEDFAAYIKRHEFGMAGFKIFSLDLESARRMICALKEAHPQTHVVLGGPHPSCSPHDVLDTFPEADYALQGEGETALPMLLRRLEEDAPKEMFMEIPGLVYRLDGGICVRPSQPVADLDMLGIPAWDLINPHHYIHSLGMWPIARNRITAPLHLTRGCPFTCRFCAGRPLTGQTVRMRSIGMVMKELHLLADEYGIREFHLIDDMVTYDRDYMLRFCAALKQEKLNMNWACPMGLRLDSLDAEMLHAMEDAGCYGAGVGIESGRQRILDFIDKGTTIEALRRNVGMVRQETKWLLVGFFIIGLPTETREDIEETINFACSLPLDAIQMITFMPLRGTPLHDYVLQELKTREDGEAPPRECGDIHVRYYAPIGMTKQEVTSLLRKANWKFLLSRPSRIFRMLLNVRHFWQLSRLARVARLRLAS